jgi:hypothetical protein
VTHAQMEDSAALQLQGFELDEVACAELSKLTALRMLKWEGAVASADVTMALPGLRWLCLEEIAGPPRLSISFQVGTRVVAPPTWGPYCCCQ